MPTRTPCTGGRNVSQKGDPSFLISAKIGPSLKSKPSLKSMIWFLYSFMCVAPKLLSLHFAHPVYVASRYFQ